MKYPAPLLDLDIGMIKPDSARIQDLFCFDSKGQTDPLPVRAHLTDTGTVDATEPRQATQERGHWPFLVGFE